MWQPIETAPKDGTVAVLLDAKKMKASIGYMVRTCGNYAFTWECASTGKMLKPSHWMPLPEPPKAGI